tara:strand:- start:248 stop:2788 length:2541 start_codon:yes stop_codon:yes gene_type:complete
MTSSFSNLVGTERDRIPDLPVSNYASTEANMEEAVNKQIDTNIADQERFFKELGDIEALKAQNFFDNLSSLNQLVGSVAQFQEARERNREARETLKFAKNLYETKQNEFLEFEEKKLDMNDAQKEAALREMAGGDPQIYEFLKARYSPDLEKLESDEFRRGYNDFAVSGFKNRVQGRNLLNKATRLEAVEGADDIIENIVTKYFMDAQAKGLNVESRDLRRHFLKELYPSLIKAKEETLRKYDTVSTNNYLKNVDREVDNLIISTVNSKNADTQEYDGIYDDEEVGLIQLVMNKKGLTKKQALNHIIERISANKGFLETAGISHFMNKAKFKHSGKQGKVSDGYINSGIGTQGEIDGNIKYLNDVISEAVKGNDKLYNTEVKASQERVRQLELQGLSETEYNMAIAEEQALFFRKLKSLGLETYAITPPHLLKDETSGVGNQPYSNQVGRANKIFDIVDVEDDYLVKLRAAKRDPNLELTSLEKNVQVKAAEYELTKKVNERMAGDKNLTLQDALDLEYPKILDKLLAGEYTSKVDITRPTLPIDIRNDQNYLKTNGIDSVMNQSKPVSIDEQRALDQLYDYYESGFKTPFPQYFREVTHGTNVMPHEYAIARYKATFPGDASNMKNPETFFDLTEEQQRFLYLRKNQTKNLQLLNDDDDTTIETNMLKSLQQRENANLYSKPDDTRGLKKFFDNRNLTELTVADAYRLAKEGYSDFGLYKFSAQELIEVVEAGGIRVDGVMDEQTQNAMVFGLMRIQANKSNSIMGALVDADKDWRRLTNLSDDERTQVLQFFPNLRDMPNNQFQNLQGDINEIIINNVTKPTKEEFFNKLIEDYVENDFGGTTI